MIVDVVYFHRIFRLDAIHSIAYNLPVYRRHASDVHWKTKSHRPRNMEWVLSKRGGEGSLVILQQTFLQCNITIADPKRILYEGQCTKSTKSQTSIEFSPNFFELFLWMVQFILNFSIQECEMGEAIAIFVCFLLDFFFTLYCK